MHAPNSQSGDEGVRQEAGMELRPSTLVVCGTNISIVGGCVEEPSALDKSMDRMRAAADAAVVPLWLRSPT